MKTRKFGLIKLQQTNEYGGFILTDTDGNTGILFDEDQQYVCTIFDAGLTILKDIVLFMEWDPDDPNTYLSRKYNIVEDTDIFGSVMDARTWFEVLEDIGVLGEVIVIDFNLPLEQALLELI